MPVDAVTLFGIVFL